MANNRLVRMIKAQEDLRLLTMNVIKVDPWVPVVLKGKEHKMEFSFGAVKELFRRTGLNLNRGEVDSDQLADLDFLCTIMLIGLKQGDPENFKDVDQEKFEYMLDMRYMQYYRTAVQTALTSIQPDPAEVDRIMGVIEEDEDKQLPLAELVDPPVGMVS